MLTSQAQFDPRRFFELYNNHVAPNLYDRLQFVIVVQDWEAMSNTFWLKTALVGAGRLPFYTPYRRTTLPEPCWRTA